MYIQKLQATIASDLLLVDRLLALVLQIMPAEDFRKSLKTTNSMTWALDLGWMTPTYIQQLLAELEHEPAKVCDSCGIATVLMHVSSDNPVSHALCSGCTVHLGPADVRKCSVGLLQLQAVSTGFAVGLQDIMLQASDMHLEDQKVYEAPNEALPQVMNLDSVLEVMRSILNTPEGVKAIASGYTGTPYPCGKIHMHSLNSKSLKAAFSTLERSDPVLPERHQAKRARKEEPTPPTPTLHWHDFYVGVSMELVPVNEQFEAIMKHMLKLGVTDLKDIMILFGRKGHGTRLHPDWGHAWSVAFGFDRKKPRGVIAWWLVFRSRADLLERLNDLVANDKELHAKFPHGLLGVFPAGTLKPKNPVREINQHLTKEEMLRIRDKLPDLAYIVKQRSGIPLFVQAGALHVVLNTEDNIKVAADYNVDGQYSMAALAHRALISPMFGARMVNDSLHSGSRSLAYVEKACSIRGK